MPVEDAAKRCPAHGGVNPVKIFAKKLLLCVLCVSREQSERAVKSIRINPTNSCPINYIK